MHKDTGARVIRGRFSPRTSRARCSIAAGRHTPIPCRRRNEISVADISPAGRTAMGNPWQSGSPWRLPRGGNRVVGYGDVREGTGYLQITRTRGRGVDRPIVCEVPARAAVGDRVAGDLHVAGGGHQGNTVQPVFRDQIGSKPGTGNAVTESDVPTNRPNTSKLTPAGA